MSIHGESRWGRRVVTAAFLLTAAYGQAPQSTPGALEREVEEIKADNAALREQLRALQEQQKLLLDLVSDLKQRLPPAGAVVEETPSPAIPAAANSTIAPPATETETASLQQPEVQAAKPAAQLPPAAPAEEEVPGVTYDDGVLLAKSDTIPFRLELWDVTQIRYTNSALGNRTFTDHLGVEHPVTVRNDFTLNRNMFQFTGFFYDPRLRYNLITWTTASTAALVVGGYVSWSFNRSFNIYGGYWGAPGSRSLTGTFPFFVQYDRSMADNFFRPSFTQGVWVDGQFGKGLSYMAFVGDGLNTLAIPLTKDSAGGLVTSGSLWWEPLGQYGLTGRARNMYDDYGMSETPKVRFGTSFTRARENRFQNLAESNPENNALFNSDGVNTFATGAFAPGVTVSDLTYRMAAFDGGYKWHGFSANGQYFLRWLTDFVADGPLPLSSTFDHGGELALAAFAVPKKLQVYARTSFVIGQFRNSNEWAGGLKFYPLDTYRVWLTGEAIRLNRTPIQSVLGGYNAGMSGWQPIGQLMFTF